MNLCKPSNRNWHMQMVTKKFYADKKQYNFRNPAWYIIVDNKAADREKYLNSCSHNVLTFMEQTGGVVMEIFGLNYTDLMRLDMPTYERIKKATYKVCETRAKAQEEVQRLEAERAKQEAAAEKARAAQRK